MPPLCREEFHRLAAKEILRRIKSGELSIAEVSTRDACVEFVDSWARNDEKSLRGVVNYKLIGTLLEAAVVAKAKEIA